MSLSEFMFCFAYRVHRADIINRLTYLSVCILFGFSLSAFARVEPVPPTPAFVAEEATVEQALPYVTLSWEIPGDDQPQPDVLFELQVAPSNGFLEPRAVYRGPDAASVISGLAEGEYFYRVRSFFEEGESSAWSEPLQLIIQYDSLAKAFLLFGIGGIVTVATVALVVIGDRRTRHEELSQP